MSDNIPVEAWFPIVRLIADLYLFYIGYDRVDLAREFARLVNIPEEKALMWVNFTLDRVMCVGSKEVS